MAPSATQINPGRVQVGFSTGTVLGLADDDEARRLYFWSVAIKLLDEECSEVERSLGHGVAVVVDSLCSNPVLVCDDESADLSSLASAVWDGDGGLSEEAGAVVEYLGGDVLLLDRIELDVDVRGQGIGLLVAAEIIRVLGRGCDVVATQAMLPGAGQLSGAERRRGSASLAQHWSRLGLKPIPGHGRRRDADR